MPTVLTIDEKVIGLAKRTVIINKQLQTLMEKNRSLNQSLGIIKSREDPVLDEKGKPTVDPYNRPVTQKMAPRNPMIGQPDLTDAIRGTVLKEVEKGIAEIENILNS